MTTYWVDADSPSPAAPYDTQAKAAHSLATILAIPPAAGDIIYCCAGASVGEITTAQLSLASSGTNAGGWIKIIGCNQDGVVDGIRYVIDANNGDFDIVDFAGRAMWWFENIEVKNAGGTGQNGFYTSVANSFGHVFINCCAHNCSGSGFAPGNMPRARFIRCVSYSNTGFGFNYNTDFAFFIFCCARDNTDSGFNGGTTGAVYFGCIAHGNGDDGFENIFHPSMLTNCVIDGNADDGISIASDTATFAPLVMGCRITNHSGSTDIGLNCNSEPVITGWNYFENNDGPNIQNATLHQFIPLEGGSATSNIEDQSNTNQGYVDPSNHDFSTGYTDAGDPDLRRTAITVPWS